jgi:hypothetical protein
MWQKLVFTPGFWFSPVNTHIGVEFTSNAMHANQFVTSFTAGPSTGSSLNHPRHSPQAGTLPVTSLSRQ